MRSAVVALAVFACSVGSLAEARVRVLECYSRSEAVADQGLRYSADLMVTSDTCRSQSYDQFAQRDRMQIIEFQNAMRRHFHRSQAKLDAYLTHLANDAALRTGQQNIAQVCAAAVKFLANADTLTDEGFRRYAEDQERQHDREYRICR